jgi:hypothetical protein
MKVIDNIIDRGNLLNAWQKVNRYLLASDTVVDFEQLYKFEGQLDYEFDLIANDIHGANWKPQRMTPIPWPKIKRDNNGKISEKIRQGFWCPIREQVAWVAVVNIIGHILDAQMPAWVFANRLFRPVWYEDPVDPEDRKSEGNKKIKIGPYRSYSEQLYRPWNRSWAMYRRSIYLTWVKMHYGDSFDTDQLDQGDNQLLKDNEAGTNSSIFLKYLQKKILA